MASSGFKRTSFFLTTLTLLTFSFVTLSASAQISNANNLQGKLNRRNSQEIQQIIQNIKEKDPTKAVSQKLTQESYTTFSSKQHNLNIELDISNKKTKVVNTKKGSVNISIPNSNLVNAVDMVDDKVVYTNSNNTETTVEAIDGGIRQVINIKSKDAPSVYDFPVEMESGDKLELADNGGAVVKNKGSQTKLTILKPWAKDADNKDLKTWYTVDGNILNQHIELANATFPVVADPQWCGDMIWKTEWKNRAAEEGGWSLMVFPTLCGRTGGVNSHEDMFKELLDKAEKRYDLWGKDNWNNNTDQGRSMYNQLRCHQMFAWFFKSSFNLEPHRPLVEWRTMISRNLPYACNP